MQNVKDDEIIDVKEMQANIVFKCQSCQLEILECYGNSFNATKENIEHIKKEFSEIYKNHALTFSKLHTCYAGTQSSQFGVLKIIGFRIAEVFIKTTKG